MNITDGSDDQLSGIEHFDYTRFDSLEDRLTEAIQKRNIATLIEELCRDEINDRVCGCLSICIAYIADSRHPNLAADQIAWIVGMNIRQGISSTKLAEKHGISKQAFSQGALKLAKRLGLAPASYLRSDKAKEKMRANHFKRTKHGN